MTPTDADLDDALRRLPTPPPAPAFWQRLDAALAASDEQTANTEPHIAGGSADVAVIDHRHHPARRQQLIAAAAALVALLVTASVITGRDHRRHPAGAQRPDSVLTDRRAISLDPWLTGAPEWPPNGAPQFLIFDVDRLPGGWTASQVGGGASLYPIADLSGVTYQWHAVLTDREGRQLLLVVSPVAPVSISPPSTNDVRGHQASWENSVLSWEERPGVYATLTTYAAPTGALAEADVVALARLLSPIEATGPAQPSQRPLATPDDAGFSGTINGHPWYAVLQPGDVAMLARLSDSAVATNAPPDSTGGLGGPAAGVIIAAGADGLLVAGKTIPATTTVRVELSDDTTIDLPTLTTGSTTWFAVPIPHGLDAVSLATLNAAGTVIGRTDVPAYSPFTAGTARFDQPLGAVDLTSTPIETTMG